MTSAAGNGEGLCESIRSVTAAALVSTLGLPFASNEGFGQEGFFDFPLAVEGSTVQALLANRDRTEEILNAWLDFDVVEQRSRLVALLEGIDAGTLAQEEVPVALSGLGGFGAVLLARSYAFNEVHEVHGKIRDYVYDEGSKSGHLAVDVRTRFFASVKDRDSGKPPIRTELLHWDVDVDGVYEVHARGLDFLNPFPDVALALPGYAIASIWNRDLRYKLHAKGRGIIVRHSYRKVDNGPLERVPSTDPRYARTDEACIDLLLHPYPPETELPAQIGYCLGRCEQPAVVNTGG
jgi:hypothetical protein